MRQDGVYFTLINLTYMTKSIKFILEGGAGLIAINEPAAFAHLAATYLRVASE